MNAQSPLRVIVVDDDADFRLLLKVQLDMREDIEVVGAAADGAEALGLTEQLAPDAIIMDLLMPNVNGFEAIDTLRSRFPEVGLVAYTAVAGNYARQQTSRAGVELVLKSGDPSQLVEALHRSIEATGRV